MVNHIPPLRGIPRVSLHSEDLVLGGYFSQRAVRLVLDHEHEHPSRWATIMSISAKIDCTGQTLNEWVKKAKIDAGKRAGVPMDMAAKLKALERENRELRQANEILRKASACFAQAELDRPFKR